METIPCLIFNTKNNLISTDCVTEVDKQLENRVGNHLYIVIESYGGDPLSAVRIIRLLQNKFSKISVIVPNYAMSAGTLMSLGADEIYMQGKSVLGPLDLQIEHPKDGSKVSVLDLKNVIFSLQTIVNGMQIENYINLRNMGLSKLNAAKLALQNANDFVKPIMNEIDPFHLQKSFREVDLAYSYGKQLLTKRMMKGNLEQAHNTLKMLINSFSSHGYGISPEEAKEELKLTIKDISELIHWDIINAEYSKGLSRENNYDILFTELPVNQ